MVFTRIGSRTVRRHPPAFGLAAAVLTLTLVPVAFAASQDIQLSFSSLPSSQGWTYTPSGSHASAVETDVFSVAASTLTMDSMGQGFGVSGGSIFYDYNGIVTTSEAKRLLVRARCLTFEGSGGAAAGQQCFCFGFTTGTTQYDVSITPTQVNTLGPSGNVAVSGTYANTTFHDWELQFTPPSSFKIFRDGVQIHSGTGGSAVALNRVFVGDGTGGGNAHAEITSFEFLQGSVTGVGSSTWGRIKNIYR
jgi:hypothetical protein